jgi:hypothetical protein
VTLPIAEVGTADDFAESWNKLKAMEDRVRRKGFNQGRVLGEAGHEIRGLTSHHLPDGTLFVAAGDKAGGIYVTCVDAITGEPQGGEFRKLPPLDQDAYEDRVVDVLRVAGNSEDPWLIVGTRGDGAWCVRVQAILDGANLHFERLPGSEGGVVRRLMVDGETVWAAVDTKLMAWNLGSSSIAPVTEIELGVRVTAIAIDRDALRSGDELYVATNRCALYKFSRHGDGSFPVTADAIATQKPAWRGRSSVIENVMPLSDFVFFNTQRGAWERRFSERGVVATTLRHVMTITATADGRVECETRRVSVLSKILAAAPVCLADWYGVAIATLEGRIRLYRPSGIRSAGHDFAPYRRDAPENEVPRSILGGFEDIDFMKERV